MFGCTCSAAATGGKDFVVAHPSADPDALCQALLRGAFEYQGQKCSAVSRAYLPRSLWRAMGADLAEQTAALTVGDVTDPAVFAGALIDERAYRRVSRAIDRAIATPSVRSWPAAASTRSPGGSFAPRC